MLLPDPRIVIVGVTGSGKTTTAARVSQILGIPHIELDSLHWLPGWVEMEREAFRSKVAEKLSASAWVTDGNYGKARDIIWGRATTLVWLDYSLPTILWQLTCRNLKRIITHEELWNGNRETFRGTFLSKDSLYLWAFKTHPLHRKTYPQILASPEYSHLQVMHMHNRQETGRWLADLERQVA